MPVSYPLTQEALDQAVQEFSRRVYERSPFARIDLRWGFKLDEVLIIVITPTGQDKYALNIATGEWYRYV